MVTSPQTTNVPSVAWKNAVIVGLGATGFSVARYLFGRGVQVTVVDAQPNPPLAMQLAKIAPGIDIRTGEDDVNNLRSADVLTIMKTEKSIKGHAYDNTKKAWTGIKEGKKYIYDNTISLFGNKH